MLNPRKISVDIVYNVLHKETSTLNEELNLCRKKTAELTELDIRFISELTSGVIRNLKYTDYVISSFSNVKLNKISPYILAILRCGVYQIIFMDRIPTSAAVNESVKIAKKSGNYKLIGFINALLRKISSEYQNIDFPVDFIERMCIQHSFPEWIVKKLMEKEEFSEEMLLGLNAKPNTTLRVNKTKTTLSELLELLNSEGWQCKKYQSTVFPDIDYLICAEKINNLSECSAYKEGLFYIQDPAAAYVGEIMKPKEGSVVFDMCASPGGKTTHFAEIMNNTGSVYAFDVNDDKINTINENAARLGLVNVITAVNDSSVFNSHLEGKADYLLVDSPCSGLGITRKKPDIKFLRKPNDSYELSKISLSILNTSAKYLKNGGTMIFSTCTILKEENEDVLFKFLELNPQFRLNKIPCSVENDGYITLYPHIHNCDGFFISLLTKEM